jgi:sugar lactone lactonase YvrE
VRTPNDIAIAADDAVYVADNDFGLRDAGKSPDKQLQNGIYRIKDGITSLVLSGSELGGEPKKQICATNEAFGGPDGKTLFIAGGDSVFTIRLKSEGVVPAFQIRDSKFEIRN